MIQSFHWSPLRTESNGVHYPSLIASESTQTHSALKRPIAGVYAMSNVTKSESYIDDTIMQLTKKFDSDFNGNGKPLNVFTWMHFCTLAILGSGRLLLTYLQSPTTLS